MNTAVEDEVETLGLLAAKCDVMAYEPTLTEREREHLLARAERYRKMQLEALERMTR